MVNIVPAKDAVESLKSAFPNAVQDVIEFAGETTIVVNPADILPVMQYLRDTTGLIFNYMSDISSVDYWEPGGVYDRPGRFGVSYHLYSMLYSRRLRVKVYLDEDEPAVETVSYIWPAANWLEREIADLMGIKFINHPDPRRLLMPDDWQGYPARRDTPLGYETVQFSFNAEEIMKHKPFAKE